MGRQEWLALLMGCFTQSRQPHRVANPSTASASCVFNSILRDCKEMPTSLSFLLISPPDVQVSQSRKTVLPLDSAFDSISRICLLPSIPGKENWSLPLFRIEGLMLSGCRTWPKEISPTRGSSDTLLAWS